jgi:hypothetical protein
MVNEGANRADRDAEPKIVQLLILKSPQSIKKEKLTRRATPQML